MKLDVTTDGKPGVINLTRKFRKLALRSNDQRNLLKRVGIQWLNEISSNFENQGNEGTAWVPLKAKTLERRRKGKGAGEGLILQDTGELRRSFTMDAGSVTLKVGTVKVYAPPHEYGWPEKNIPQRKMLPTDQRELEIAITTAESFISARKKDSGL